ncbi:MAP kinase-activating death domain protein-like [Lingula anatina]|uniref:MAP kinase-activating death domain protein-like n=1 Tax=Lingula anatina TaxID=7574 RepID=A0A1S3H7W3_LINAN|nr:MAP kinase-activating death domain protein-like [Lingula anatina]XP_013382084.1 MAP kinase-activating death domain protein-like [Lingula anatina]|eukprot:XP_013382083.1 MAP kinase-activating death domain protein-like [Lingula anatina]
MGDACKKDFCPRLVDYLIIVGSRHPSRNNSVASTPELLRRYPDVDHPDFALAPDIVFFCQPEGCISVGPKRMSLRESTSFVFTLTEKDSGKTRYGICVNFYRPFIRRSKSESLSKRSERTESVKSSESSNSDRSANVPGGEKPRARRRLSNKVRNHTLTSLCLVSHHPFFSKFRECLTVLRRLIDGCNERCSMKRLGGSVKGSPR